MRLVVGVSGATAGLHCSAGHLVEAVLLVGAPQRLAGALGAAATKP